MNCRLGQVHSSPANAEAELRPMAIVRAKRAFHNSAVCSSVCYPAPS